MIVALKEGYFNEPSRRNHDLKYNMMEGKFELWTSTYAKIGCQMDYSMYPFDTHQCEFRMRSVTKNMTYEGRLIRLK